MKHSGTFLKMLKALLTPRVLSLLITYLLNMFLAANKKKDFLKKLHL